MPPLMLQKSSHPRLKSSCLKSSHPKSFLSYFGLQTLAIPCIIFQLLLATQDLPSLALAPSCSLSFFGLAPPKSYPSKLFSILVSYFWPPLTLFSLLWLGASFLSLVGFGTSKPKPSKPQPPTSKSPLSYFGSPPWAASFFPLIGLLSFFSLFSFGQHLLISEDLRIHNSPCIDCASLYFACNCLWWPHTPFMFALYLKLS